MSALRKILGPVEVIFLLVAFVGLAFRYLSLNGGAMMVMISFSVLALIYFLRAFMPVPVPEPSAGRQLGFTDLLSTAILPKVAWIGSSIAIVGLMYASLHFLGTANMLMVGSAVTGVATVLIIFFLFTGSASKANLIRVLFRVVPLAIISTYVLTNLPPGTR